VVLTTILGEYDNGQIRLSGAPPVVRWARVLVTFLEEGQAAVAPPEKRTVADGLAALGSLSLTEEEERILDDLESFRWHRDDGLGHRHGFGVERRP